MIKKLVLNDIKHNKLFSGAAVFFMAVSAMLLALTVLLTAGLLGAIDSLMAKAQVPDYMQMHAGDQEAAVYEESSGELPERQIARFAGSCEAVEKWQICRFLNLDNSRLSLGGKSLADSTQDNGLSMQGEQFDYLLTIDNEIPEVLQGEVYVPVCYRSRYELTVRDQMEIGDREFVIAGFLRDAQMNSMMASSKRFLVNEADYKQLKEEYAEEYLIEFLLRDGTDSNVFAAAYAAAGLPANGPAITRALIRMMNALSDGTMIFIIFLVSIVVLLISLLCIRFMLSLQMERDRKEVGMLKALGVGKAQIRRLYFAKYLIFSVCGGLVGVLTAFCFRDPLERQIRELYGVPADGLRAGILSLMAALFTEGIILLSVHRFLRRTDKMSALTALSAARDQERKHGRRQYLLIGFVAAACTFLALVPQNLYSTMSDPAFVRYMGIGDGAIRMDVRQADNIDAVTKRIADTLEKDARVEKYAVLRTGSCTAVLSNGEMIHLPVETGDHHIFPVNYSKGRPPEGEKEIALSSMNAEELGLSVGDSLHLMIRGETAAYLVCGIYSDITNGGRTAKAYQTDDEIPPVWSVLYVSLNEAADMELWMEEYRQMGADVIAVADYVKDTYSQTLEQLRLASVSALGMAVLVTAVVPTLFMRLIVEKNRYAVSLHKALGFTGSNMRRIYFRKGICPALAGIAAGVLCGNLCGEGLCGVMLRSFGVDSFHFTFDPVQAFLVLPGILLVTAAAAVWTGIREIRRVSAWECCSGMED